MSKIEKIYECVPLIEFSEFSPINFFTISQTILRITII